MAELFYNQSMTSVAKISVQSFLRAKKLEKGTLWKKDIEIMLTAAILRYLQGLTSLDFPLDLANTLYADAAIYLNGNTLEAVSLLAYLKFKTRPPQDRDINETTIKKYLYTALRKLEFSFNQEKHL